VGVVGWLAGVVQVGVGWLEALVGWGRQLVCSDSPEPGYDRPLPDGARTVVVGVGGVGRRVVMVVVNTAVASAEAGRMDIVEEALRNHGLPDTTMEQERKHSYAPSASLK